MLGALYAALVSALGVGGLAFVRLGAVAVTALGLHRAAAPESHPNVAAAAVSVALLGYGDRFASPRPMGVVLALAALVLAVGFDPGFRARHVAMLGALGWVWACCHGSYPLAFVLLVAALGEPGNRRARLLGLVVLAVGVSCTPYGLSLHGLVGRYLAAGPDDPTGVVHTRILEWWPLLRAPLRVATVAQLGGYALLCGAAVAMLRVPRWRWRGLVMAVLLAMALQHNRHLFVAATVSLGLVAAPLSAWWASPATVPWRGAGWAVALGMLLPVVLALGALRGRSEGQWLDPSRDDEDLTALVGELPPGARVFVGLPFVGWALWVGDPAMRVFWDPRNDCYPARVVRQALDLEDGRVTAVQAQAWLSETGTTHAVVLCEGPTARLLRDGTVPSRRGRLCMFRRAGGGLQR